MKETIQNVYPGSPDNPGLLTTTTLSGFPTLTLEIQQVFFIFTKDSILTKSRNSK